MSETLIRALVFAAYKHRDQRRKGSEVPYINHPLDVLHILRVEAKVTDEVALCAAVLHDTVEDTDTTPEELAAQFGPEIADVVAEVTDDKSLPKATRKQLQIEHAPHASYAAKLVKLADKIANARDMGHAPPKHWPAERVAAYIAWSAQVVQQLRGTHAVLEDLYDAAGSAGN